MSPPVAHWQPVRPQAADPQLQLRVSRHLQQLIRSDQIWSSCSLDQEHPDVAGPCYLGSFLQSCPTIGSFPLHWQPTLLWGRSTGKESNIFLTPSRYWDDITLKEQVGHRLGPQPQFLQAPQVHQVPIGVAKRPGGALSGGNVQTNGRNIVNMAPPGPGVSTRGKLHLLSTLIILKLYHL